VSVLGTLALKVLTIKTDHLAKEREDVNKLVTDLIGGSALTSPPKAVSSAPPPSTAQKSPVKTSPTKSPSQVSAGRSRQVKLVVDQLAPVNIRPKVGKGLHSRLVETFLYCF